MARRSSGRVCMRLRIVVLFVIFFVAVISWNAPVVSSQTPDEETPKDDVPSDDVPKDDTPKDDVAKDDGVKDEITKDDDLKDEVPADDVPKDEVPKDDVPKDDGEKDDVQLDSEKDGKVDDEVIPKTEDGTQKPEEVLTDLDPNGKCSKEIKTLCTKESESALDCISRELMSVQMGVSSHSVSEGCKKEWRDLKVALYKDVTLSKKIMDVCEKDIEKSCSADFLPGGVLACLRRAKDELSQACQDEVFVVELDAVYDFTMDTLLSDTCQQDAAKYCKGIAPGEGRVQACLRSHTGDISYHCKTELFRQETENAGDIRLNVGLYKACLPDKEKFCSNVKPGNSRLKDCLEDNRLKPDFSPSCTTEFDKLLARRSADFRLNTRLKETCDRDIKLLCSEQFLDKGEIPNDEPAIIHCLQDYREALTSTECKMEVHKLLSLAAEDYRFDKEFADSCEDAKQKLCKTSENDKVLSCLQGQRESLDNKCRAAVFTLEWRLSGDIDYKFAMKQACSVEIPKFCPDSRHDHGDTIECLQQHVSIDIEMRDDCRKEILRDQVESAKDYRLNYRIYKDCRQDVHSLCEVPKVCRGAEPCGGVVLKCLQDNLDKLGSDSCKQDIKSFELKETKNMELNVPLQTACKDALPKLCARRRNQDHGKTLQCLRAHRSNLTDDCKEEELRFSMMEASDIRLTPSLMNACGAEMQRFCKNVSPLNGESFKCLQLNLESVLMGVGCKVEVDLQGLRQASDYRLDVRVRTECKDDVKRFCSSVDKREDGHAPVLKCFLTQFRNLTRGCQTEVSYATRMALWQYKFGSALTLPCDDTVRNSCNGTDSKDIDGVYIGTYGQCLTTLRKKTFDPACRRLVWVATREGFFIGNSTDADTAAALFKYNELRNADELSQSRMGLFWVTTGVCLVAILAVGLFRRYSGPPKTYTLVVKQGDI